MIAFHGFDIPRAFGSLLYFVSAERKDAKYEFVYAIGMQHLTLEGERPWILVNKVIKC